MSAKKTVLFFIEALIDGGAEQVLATLAKHLDKERYDVTVCSIIAGGKYADEIKKYVPVIELFRPRNEYKGLGKLWYILKYRLIYHWLPLWLVYRLFVPKGYDVEVAFVEGFATKLLAASSNKMAKKIAWVHVDLIQRPWPIEHGVFKDMEEERTAYNRYDKVVCVSKSVEEIMIHNYHLKNTTTIYNPLDSDFILSQGKQQAPFEINKTKFNIVSVGRYTKQKGYDLLLPIFAKLRITCPDTHLWLIGEGPERTTLEQQAADLNITEHVTFTGFLKNPYALMSKMNLFVCSSRAEGFSLVIAESLILGVPVISMNCSGPNELIGNNKCGILCDSYEQLYTEIAKAVDGNKIPCQVPEMVNLESTMTQIHQLLDL